jgi:hypothetical protein
MLPMILFFFRAAFTKFLIIFISLVWVLAELFNLYLVFSALEVVLSVLSGVDI